MSQIVLQPTTLATASAGVFEYDGKVPYVTPQSTQRGLIPGMQYYRLNSPLAGLNSSVVQNILGVGVELSANTIYAFEGVYAMSKTAGTTGHTFSWLFGGTATVNSIGYMSNRSTSAVSYTDTAGTLQPGIFSQVTTATVITGTRTSATYYDLTRINGTVSINAAGTFIPQYKLSAAPGGAYTTAQASSFLIYPIGTAGSNISVGTWA